MGLGYAPHGVSRGWAHTFTQSFAGCPNEFIEAWIESFQAFAKHHGMEAALIGYNDEVIIKFAAPSDVCVFEQAQNANIFVREAHTKFSARDDDGPSSDQD